MTARLASLPSSPETAFLIGALYQRLGCSFCIDSNGERVVIEPCYFEREDKRQPFPDAEPHEQFYCADEWRGAIKLLAGLLRRMSAADRDFVYDLFALEAVDPRALTPSIEEPRRVA